MFSNVTSTAAFPLALTSEAEKGNVPNTYIGDDERLKELIEFQIATWMNDIYRPLCAGFGILGNLASLCVLLSPRMANSSTSVYLSSLSISDSLFQVANILFLVRKLKGHEILHHGSCGFGFFLLYFSTHFSVTVTMAMTLERYLAIRFPLKVGKWSTVRRARIMVVVICTFAFLLNCHRLAIMKMKWNDVLKVKRAALLTFLVLVGEGDRGEERTRANRDVCVPDGAQSEFFVFKVWPWVDGFIYFYLPFVSLAVLNVLIILQMRSSDKFRGTSGSADQADISRQVTVMLLLVTFAFLLFVGPMAVITVVERYVWVRTTLHEQAVFHLTRTIINSLCFTNHAINFGLYCLSGNRFRQEFLRLFCPCLSDRKGTKKGGKGSDSCLKSNSSNTSATLAS